MVFRESKELIKRATQKDFSDFQGTRQRIRVIILGHQLYNCNIYSMRVEPLSLLIKKLLKSQIFETLILYWQILFI
ncbi:MAG: hypothetical protein UR96_C0007G0009 [candidate division WS6 bacterium GW2011_GWC1_36_11]|uniref:Uncharacterized protein n=3 Tax=Candidatus Dojkabacteria TaxID=74243 RepID=A0A0G0FZC3_9BACT|nr:MAG: hypothetical protein UR96_C0007G0009 [candidate division WS6 bacterium GW2011_GWC1_36_11]KKQ04119.1 MAG: hypothetical protein US14_C0023G0008 [candidate division WS6 bacterium GW2011_WS6_36_26]KKQ10872.1 MAG: hypothetical protein US24_C0052G0010 [candidate division WS6 bacterium GW2011_GWC2_36_7]KKQ15525.1 MAG: hypothetical protein US29_C0042G0003 [candidate division WS6 bacterium GW2011_GWF1_36_8]HAM37531.1 hypothetical protein [Patescibacteria group bacterium]